jgi:hypothetical protein
MKTYKILHSQPISRCILLIALILLPERSWAKMDPPPRPTTLYQENVGAVHVAAIGVTPWEDAKAALQPVFNLNENKAFDQAIPVTLQHAQDLLNALTVGLKIAAGPTSFTRTQETDGNGDEMKNTIKEVREYKAGELQAIKPPSAEAGQSKLPAHPGQNSLAVADALTRYQNAKTLFQMVRLMDRSIEDAATRSNFRPFVVTLQVSLMPYARSLPYDAYSTISFFSGEKGAGGNSGSGIPQKSLSASNLLGVASFPKLEEEQFKGLVSAYNALGRALEQALQTATRSDSFRNPVIVPLLATDNMEAMSDVRAIAQIQQFTFALAAMIKGIGLDAGADYYRKFREQTDGYNLNSLLTVGRLTDNSIQVRLGAMQQAASRYARTSGIYACFSRTRRRRLLARQLLFP